MTQKHYNTFIGIDVDKKSYSFTIKDFNIMKKSKRIPANPENLYNYIKKTYHTQQVICAYEAGPTGFNLYDYLTEKEIPCLVVSPLSIPHAPNERVKNNRIDSEKITHYLSTGKLKSIRVPQGAYRELRHLVKIRENYAASRKTAKQRIKALLLSTSLHSAFKDPRKKWSRAYITELKQVQCPPAVRTRLNMLIMDLNYARKNTLSIHRTIRTFCKNNKEIGRDVNYLQSIPGIGFITSVTILGKIGDPKQLKDVREIASFVGLVPTERSTGDSIKQGSITHLGNQTLRFLLIEAAWVAIRHNTELCQFFHRIRMRNNPKVASRKAIVAVARKLTQRIYRILKDQREYINY